MYNNCVVICHCYTIYPSQYTCEENEYSIHLQRQENLRHKKKYHVQAVTHKCLIPSWDAWHYAIVAERSSSLFCESKKGCISHHGHVKMVRKQTSIITHFIYLFLISHPPPVYHIHPPYYYLPRSSKDNNHSFNF